MCFHTRFTFPAIEVESAFSLRSVEFLYSERVVAKARIFYQAKINYLMYTQDAFRQQLADNFLRHEKIAVVFRQGICHIKFGRIF